MYGQLKTAQENARSVNSLSLIHRIISKATRRIVSALIAGIAGQSIEKKLEKVTLESPYPKYGDILKPSSMGILI